MLLSLVKKDFILVKKYALFMAAFCFLLPVFFLSRLPEFAGSLTFFISVVYTIFLLLQYVFLKEYQSPKAALLLCASPYPRRLMVTGKICVLSGPLCRQQSESTGSIRRSFRNLEGFIGKWLF